MTKSMTWKAVSGVGFDRPCLFTSRQLTSSHAQNPLVWSAPVWLVPVGLVLVWTRVMLSIRERGMRR